MQYGANTEGMPDKDNIVFHLEEEDNMKIIDNYRDLSIGMYLDICEIDRREDIEELHKQVQIISMLTGETEESIYDLPLDEYKTLALKTDYLRHPYEGEVLTAKEYRVGKWVLVPVSDYRKITTAQYIDFQSFSKEGEKRIVEVLSTMLVPKGKRYNQDYDVVELQKDLRLHLSVVDALTLFAFFFVQYNQLIRDSLISCKEEAMRIPDKRKREQILKEIARTEALLQKNGVGSHV